MKLEDIISLARVRQWYKNLVVFLAIFFSGGLVQVNLLATIITAFISLCLISSAGYIINDILDVKNDRENPEKRKRPLASGRIKKGLALFLMIILVAGGFIIAETITIFFLYSTFFLFLATLLYTFVLKKIIFADVLSIAVLFVLRAVAGALAIKAVISPWLILGPFFLSLFLSLGKRHAELSLLKEKSQRSREVLKDYNFSLTTSLMIISTTLLIISYALYSFLSEYNYLIYTIPFALFVIFRFYYLIQQGSFIARHPEAVIQDLPMVIGMGLLVMATVMIIYG